MAQKKEGLDRFENYVTSQIDLSHRIWSISLLVGFHFFLNLVYTIGASLGRKICQENC